MKLPLGFTFDSITSGDRGKLSITMPFDVRSVRLVFPSSHFRLENPFDPANAKLQNYGTEWERLCRFSAGGGRSIIPEEHLPCPLAAFAPLVSEWIQLTGAVERGKSITLDVENRESYVITLSGCLWVSGEGED